jgi:hypothetical protein
MMPNRRGLVAPPPVGGRAGSVVAVVFAAETGAALGLPAATALLVAMEAGVPIPVPSDMVILLLGERARRAASPSGSSSSP